MIAHGIRILYSTFEGRSQMGGRLSATSALHTLQQVWGHLNSHHSPKPVQSWFGWVFDAQSVGARMGRHEVLVSLLASDDQAYPECRLVMATVAACVASWAGMQVKVHSAEALTSKIPCLSTSMSCRGNNMKPPQTNFVCCCREKAIRRGRW